ncbi:MAG: hypothetical protein JKX76_02130 [Colwellia sp.]|nr:hypothetical protein [Colwellia sp.]
MNILKYQSNIKYHANVLERVIKRGPPEIRSKLKLLLRSIRSETYTKKEFTIVWDCINDIMIASAINYCFTDLLDWYSPDKIINLHEKSKIDVNQYISTVDVVPIVITRYNHLSREFYPSTEGFFNIIKTNFSSLSQKSQYELKFRNFSYPSTDDIIKMFTWAAEFSKKHTIIFEMSYDLIKRLIREKQYDVVIWALDYHKMYSNAQITSLMVKAGSLNFVKWLYRITGCLSPLISLYAIENNHMNILDYMYVNRQFRKFIDSGYKSQYRFAIKSAFKRGHIDVLEWLYEKAYDDSKGKVYLKYITVCLPGRLQMSWAEKYRRQDLLDLGERRGIFPFPVDPINKRRTLGAYFTKNIILK